MKKHLVLMSVIALVAVACGSSPTVPSPAPATSIPATLASTSAPPTSAPMSTPAAQLDKVTITCKTKALTLLFLPCDVAQALDLFKQEGLDMTSVGIGPADAYNAQAKGELDFSSWGMALPIQSQGQSKTVQMVVEFERFPAVTLLIRSALKDKIKTVADLKGETIGSPGGPPTPLFYIAAKEGLKPKDITILGVELDASQMAGQIQKGVLDAALLPDPYATQLIQSGSAYALVDFTTEMDSTKWLGGECPVYGLVTTTEMIQKRPQTVQHVTNALVKALRFIATHSAADIAAILPDKVTGQDRALYIAALQHMLPSFSKDGLVSAGGVKNFVDIDKALGVIKPDQQINVDALYTNDFANNVK